MMSRLIGNPAGKEEERAMFQQMQAMAQKQVNTLSTLSFCLIFVKYHR